MDEATDTIELALFPLNTVLFPGQVLPLHIFEDRYRLMVRRCLADELPFGVVLIKQGEEVGAEAEPYSVGTLARIIESTHLPNGTMNIITVGIERFHIRRLIHDQPYLRGEVETLPLAEQGDTDALVALADGVRERVALYIKLIAEAAGLEIKIDQMPDLPQQIGYLAAITMQIDNREKQELLVSPSLAAILGRARTLLNRENALLTWMAGSKAWPEQAQFGPSGTLLPN
ncbi:MAG: Lon protease 2 [Chloroflexi bacterium ADurb.Bin325]|nr:MAG: Lon protease 2 [Chloroflexi bacterium ADurb.Bin325]